MTMQSTTNDLKTEIQKGMEQLRTLRDEVRVQLHLAGMEAKDRWNKLEPQLLAVEQVAHQATEATRKSLADGLKALEDLRASLRG